MLRPRTSIVCVIFVCLPSILAECRESYVTICNNFDDLEAHRNKESITELVIGSDPSLTEMSAVHLMTKLRLAAFHRMTSLTVLGVINRLESTYAYECTSTGAPLQYVNFYGNKMSEIREYHFPVFEAKRLSLRNNKIESIKAGAFNNHEILEFDVSDNLLEVLEKDGLPRTGATKVIKANNNKISHVESESFPSDLQALHLDNNKLRYILSDIFDSVTNLEELSLSNNHFTEIPADIRKLRKLRIFDISYNKINSIEKGLFGEMDDLRFLDLSGNKLSYSFALSSVIVPGKQPQLLVSLAMNGLTTLNTTGILLQKQVFALWGNPWHCRTWTELERYLEGHRTQCEKRFFSSGKTPFCFNVVQADYWLNDNFKRDVEMFQKETLINAKVFECNLKPLRYDLGKRIFYGCVS